MIQRNPELLEAGAAVADTAASARGVPPSMAQRVSPLGRLFYPKSVAVIGASETPRSVGRALVENLSAFAGSVFPVNPHRRTVLGNRCFPSISDTPGKVDLAVIATPAPSVPDVLRECVHAGVAAAVVISAGFRESGAAGKRLEERLRAELKGSSLRLIGPNCLGLMNPAISLNASFAAAMPRPGHIAFLSQSGALCTAILDWSLHENVGFSAFVSTGSMVDVGWSDLIFHFGDDPETRSILIYMESVGDARSFLSAAREVAFTKPILVLKAGATEAASRAAVSHTGALTGSDAVFDAALRRAGVLRVGGVEELFDMAEVLSKQPAATGSRLTIVTNAGGPGVLATDALVRAGGSLAAVSPAALAELNPILSPSWSHSNPIDLLGDASAEAFSRAIDVGLRQPQSDGVLAILTPQAMTDPTGTARNVAALRRPPGTVLLASWMGGARMEAGEKILNEAGIPTYRFPEQAVRAFELMAQHRENLRQLRETPDLLPLHERTAIRSGPLAHRSPEYLIQAARKAGRTLLTECESKQILASYDIPVVETEVAFTVDEAVAHAKRLGFPVAVKLFSETLTHKGSVGGVQLDIRNSSGVRRAWDAIRKNVSEKAGLRHFLGVTVQPMIPCEGQELILGFRTDPDFGPVMLFGSGGRWVETLKDQALALPPLTGTLARCLMRQTRVFRVLQEQNADAPVDLTAIETILVRFSQLAAGQRWISEMEINPLRISENRIVALDARTVLHPPGTPEESIPRLAIRPYPNRYQKPVRLRNGGRALIRPIRPEDEPLMAAFHRGLSEETVYDRYFAPMRLEDRIAHERLSRVCFIDYDRELALVVERTDPKTGGVEILGVGRLSKLHGMEEGEFAILIADAWQNQGFGTELLKMLVQAGRDEKLRRITASILPGNRAMQRVSEKAGFAVRHELSQGECVAELTL